MKYYKHADGEPLCLGNNPMDDMGERFDYLGGVLMVAASIEGLTIPSSLVSITVEEANTALEEVGYPPNYRT